MTQSKEFKQGKYLHHFCISVAFLLISLCFATNLYASSQPYLSGHDVNFAVGNKYLAENDLSLNSPVGSSLTFRRSYNSQSVETSPLGFGWSFPYGSKLKIKSDRIILIATTGRHFHYINNGEGAWINETGSVNTITPITNGYQLALSDGTKVFFDQNGKITEKQFLNDLKFTYTYDADNNLSCLADSFGKTFSFTYNDKSFLEILDTPAGIFTYSYDDNSNLISVLKPDGKIRQYIYDDPNDIHNLTGIINEAGEDILTVVYDKKDRVVSSSLSNASEKVTIEYPSSLQRVITGSNGVSSTYQLTQQYGIYRVSSFTGPGCSACGADTGSEYSYNNRQQIEQVTDAKGHITYYEYDKKGNRVTKVEAVGMPEERATTYTYEPLTNKVATITRQDESLFKSTSMTYDDAGNLLTRTETGSSDEGDISRTTAYTYDSWGRITSINGPRTDVNDVTTITYYPNTSDQGLNRGYLQTVTNALGYATTYSQYNAFGRAGTTNTPTAATTYSFDTMGKVLTQNHNGLITANTYDDAGRLIRTDLPGSRYIAYTYEANGKPGSIRDSLGNSVVYTYDANGKKIKEEVFDPQKVLQRFVSYSYEETGELDKTIYADGSFEDLNYDPVGNLVTRVNALGKSTWYGYDALDRLSSMTEPGNVITGYEYDNFDNTGGVTDAEGRTTYYTYDGLGDKLSRISPDTGLTSYSYDEAGNLLTETDANGITKTYEYDALNRLVAVHYPDPAQDVMYTYDQNGNVGLLTTIQDSTGTTAYQYDLNGRMVSEERVQGANSFTFSYGYNDNSELTSITYPSGRIINYQRNTVGQIMAVTSTYDGVTSTLSDAISYLPYGPQASMTLGNGLNVSKSYDQLYRLTNTSVGNIYNRVYGYYANGTVQSITDNINSAASQNFTYDDLDRLTGAEGKYGSYAWSYDNVGNRLSQIFGAENTSYNYETGTSRLARVNGTQTTDYFYDAAGNMTTRGNTELNWDENNRLADARVNAEQVGEYGYDSRNLQTIRTVDGQTVHTLYDQSGNILAETNDHGEVLREFAYLNGIRIFLFDYTFNPEVYVDVSTSDDSLLNDVTVYAFDEHNLYTGISAVTDEEGVATFMRDDFGDGSYTFRVDYLGGQSWSKAEDVRRVERLGILVQVEQVDMTVTMAGEIKPDVNVYLYTDDGQYLGIFGTTDATGNVAFTLAEGVEYLFKTEILGNEFWSSPITVADGGSSGTIDTGGGLLSLNIGESETLPLSSLQTYLYNMSGTYLGLAAVTSQQGIVSYLVPEGSYQIRVDYLGYQIWSNSYYVTAPTVGTLYIPHQDVQVYVGFINDRGVTKPVQDVVMTLYTPSGTGLDRTGVSDHKGMATFHVPELQFRVGAACLDHMFWSQDFIWQDAEILIETGTATLTVTSLGTPLKDVPVTVVSTSGIVQDLAASTNGKGEGIFQVPAGTYLFRAVYQGHQYMSDETQVIAFQDAFETIDVGGGSFILNLMTDSGDPLKKIQTTLFTASGIELDQAYKTDNKGLVSFDMAEGTYQIRIDYMGYAYWTDIISIPDITSLDYTIEHRDVTVAATTDYLGDLQPLKNVKVQLWTPDGTYLKTFEKIGKDFFAHFSLPCNAYVFNVEYLDRLFPSEPLTWTNTEVIIEEGVAEISLQDMGTPLAGVPVSVFSEDGVDLGLSAATDANGLLSFRLPEGNYRFQAEYDMVSYWAVGTVIAHQVTPLTMNTGDGTITLTVQSDSSALDGVSCSLCDATGVYQNQSGITDNLGLVSFDVADGDYYIAVEYRGGQYQSGIFTVPGTIADTLVIEQQQVAVTVTGDNGITQEPLADVRCYLYTETGVYTEVLATTDASGVSYFNVPFNTYKVLVEYLGGQFWSDPFDWFDTTVTVPLGDISLHVTDLGADAAGAEVYLFSDAGQYLNISTITDAAGAAYFSAPAGTYQLRVDYGGIQYWSDIINVLEYHDNSVSLALDLLALDLTNNPYPVRFDGKAPEYWPMVASIGSLAGLLTQAVTTSDPRTYYYISDHLTTAQLLVDDFGEVVWQGNYKPFGEVDIVVNTLENNFRFPGQYYDSETGLHYNWHRYYDPATGRYISADPIGLAGGMNLYAYVGGNPLNKKDRKGLYKGDEFDGLSPPFGPDPSPSNGPPRGPFGTICGQEGSDSARWIPDITPRACQRHDNCYDRCARNCYGYWCKTLCDMQLGASNPPYGGATFWFGREAYDAARAKYGCEGCNE